MTLSSVILIINHLPLFRQESGIFIDDLHNNRSEASYNINLQPNAAIDKSTRYIKIETYGAYIGILYQYIGSREFVLYYKNNESIILRFNGGYIKDFVITDSGSLLLVEMNKLFFWSNIEALEEYNEVPLKFPVNPNVVFNEITGKLYYVNNDLLIIIDINNGNYSILLNVNIRSFDVESSGNYIAYSTPQGVLIYNNSDNTSIAVPQTIHSDKIIWHPSKLEIVLSVNNQELVQIWDISNLSQKEELNGVKKENQGVYKDFAFDRAGDRLGILTRESTWGTNVEDVYYFKVEIFDYNPFALKKTLLTKKDTSSIAIVDIAWFGSQTIIIAEDLYIKFVNLDIDDMT